MMGLIIVIHVIICVLLIIVILIQAGRGGGLVESLSGIESMFGTKTNTFLTRTTTVLATLFLITCLSLAFLSAKQSRSLMKNIKPAAETSWQQTQNATGQQIPQSETPKQQESPAHQLPAQDAPKAE